MDKKKKIIWIIGILVIIMAVLVAVFVMKSPRQEKDYIVVSDSEKIELIDLASENKDSIVIDKFSEECYFELVYLSPEKDKVIYINNVVPYGFDGLEYDVMLYNIATRKKTILREKVISFDVSKDFSAIVFQEKDSAELYHKNLITGEEKLIYKNCYNYYASDDLSNFLCFDKYGRCFLINDGKTQRIGSESIEIHERNNDLSTFYYSEGTSLVRYNKGEFEELMDNFIPEYGEYVAENELVFSAAEPAKCNEFIIDDMAEQDEIKSDSRTPIREQIREYLDIANLEVEFSQITYLKDGKMNLVSDGILSVMLAYDNPETGENIVVSKVVDKNNLPQVKISELDDYGMQDAIELTENYKRIISDQTSYSVFKNGEFVGTVEDLTLIENMDYATYVEDESTIYFRSVSSVNHLKNHNRSTIYSVKIEDGKLGELQQYTDKIKSSNEILEEFDGKLVYSAENEDGKETLYWGDEVLATGFYDFYKDEALVVNMGNKKPSIILYNGKIKSYEEIKGCSWLEYVGDSGVEVYYDENDQQVLVDDDVVTVLSDKRFYAWSNAY